MKKNYFLLSGLALMSAGLLAQGVSVNAPEAQAKLTNAKADKAKAVATNKAPLDTLYYDSFAGGPNATDMPVGTWGGQTVNWTSINPNNNGFDWIWSDQAPGGQYSTTVTALTSTSAADGYLSMPADAYNTPAPGPGGNTVDVDADSVWLQTDYQAGDILLFKSLTVHAAADNHTEDVIRLSIDFRYTGYSHTISDSWLQPHFHWLGSPFDWETLQADWTDSPTANYWQHIPNLKVKPHHGLRSG